MTKDEALKLALEALEHEADKGNDDAYKLERDAIKEALAQPEQETLAWEQFYPDMGKPQLAPPHPWEKFCDSNCVWTDHHPDCKLAQPEQEPVGKFAKFTDGIWREVTDGSAGVPLYTTPPQRTWIGLTDQEILEKCESVPDYDIGNHDLIQFARAIEAKLKEKNT